MEINNKRKSIYYYKDRSENSFSGKSSQDSISSLGDYLNNTPSNSGGKINFMKNYFWFFKSNNNSKKNSHDSIFSEIKSADGNKGSSHQLDADSDHVMQSPDGSSNHLGDVNGHSLGKTNEESKGVSSRKSFYSIYDYTDESDYNTLRENEQDDSLQQQKTFEPSSHDRYPKGECARKYMHIYDTDSSPSNDSNEGSSDGNSDSSGESASAKEAQDEGHKTLPTQGVQGQEKQGPTKEEKKRRAKWTSQEKMENLINSYKIKKGKSKIQYVGISAILKKYIYITKNEKILFFKKELNKKKILVRSKIKKRYNPCATFYYLHKKQKNALGTNKTKINKCHFFRYLYYCMLKKKLQIFYRTRKLKSLIKYASSQGWRRSYVSQFWRDTSKDALKGRNVEENHAKEDADGDVKAEGNTSNSFIKIPSHSDTNKAEGFVSVRSCPKSPRQDGQGSSMHLPDSEGATPKMEEEQLTYGKKDTAYVDGESFSQVCIKNCVENKTGHHQMEQEANQDDKVMKQNHISDEIKNDIKNMPTYDCYKNGEEGFSICTKCKDECIDYAQKQGKDYMLSEDIITLKGEMVLSKGEEHMHNVQAEEMNDVIDLVKCKNSSSAYGSDSQEESFKMDSSADREEHSSGEVNALGEVNSAGEMNSSGEVNSADSIHYVSSEIVRVVSDESIERDSFHFGGRECAGNAGSAVINENNESSCGSNEEESSTNRIESEEMRSNFSGEEDIAKVKGSSERWSGTSDDVAVGKMEHTYGHCSATSEEDAISSRNARSESCSDMCKEQDANGSNGSRNMYPSSSSRGSYDVSVEFIESSFMKEIHAGGKGDHAECSHADSIECSNEDGNEDSNGGSNEEDSQAQSSSGSNDTPSICQNRSQTNSHNDTGQDGPSDASVSAEERGQVEEEKKESQSENATSGESFVETINLATEENVHVTGHPHVHQQLQNGESSSLYEEEEEEVEVDEDEEDDDNDDDDEGEEGDDDDDEDEEEDDEDEEYDEEEEEEHEADEIEVDEEVKVEEQVDVEPKETVEMEPKETTQVKPLDTRKVVNSEEEIQNNMEMEIRKSIEEIFKTVFDNDILAVDSQIKKFNAFWDAGEKDEGTIGDEEDSLKEQVGDMSDRQGGDAENEEDGESSEEELVEEDEPSETENDEEGEEDKDQPGHTQIGELEEVVQKEPVYTESEVLDENANKLVDDGEADETVSNDDVADDMVEEEELPDGCGDKVLLRKNAFSFSTYKNKELLHGFRMESLNKCVHAFDSVNSEYADMDREGEEMKKEKEKGAEEEAQEKTTKHKQITRKMQSMKNESDIGADFQLNVQMSVEDQQLYSHLQKRIMRDLKKGYLKKMKKMFKKKCKQMKKDITDNIKTIVHKFNNPDEALEGEIQFDTNVKSLRKKPRKTSSKKGQKKTLTNIHTDGYWTESGTSLRAKEETAPSVESSVHYAPNCAIVTDKGVDIGGTNTDGHIVHAVISESDRMDNSTGEVLRGDQAQVGTSTQDIHGSHDSLRLIHSNETQEKQQPLQDLQQVEDITHNKQQAHQQIVSSPQGSKKSLLPITNGDGSSELDDHLARAQDGSNQLELDVSTTNGSMDRAQKYFLQKLKCEKICLVTKTLGNKSELFNRINSMTKKCIANAFMERMNNIRKGPTVWDATTKEKEKIPVGSSPISEMKLDGEHRMLLLHEGNNKQTALQSDKTEGKNPNDYSIERYETKPQGAEYTQLQMTKNSKELHSVNNCNDMKLDACKQKLKRVTSLNYVKHKLSKWKKNDKCLSAKQVMKYYRPCRRGTVEHVYVAAGHRNKGNIITHGGISNVGGVNHVFCVQHADANQKKAPYKEQAGGKFVQLYFPHSASSNRNKVPNNLFINPNAIFKGNNKNVQYMVQRCLDGKLVPYMVQQQNGQQVHAQCYYYPVGAGTSTDISTNKLNNHYICLRKKDGTCLNGYYVHSGESHRGAPSNESDYDLAFLQNKFTFKAVSGELSNGKVKMCVNKNNLTINKYRRCNRKDKLGPCRESHVGPGGHIRGAANQCAVSSNCGKTDNHHVGNTHAHTAAKLHSANSQGVSSLKVSGSGAGIFLGSDDVKHQMGGKAGGANRVVLVDYKNGSLGVKGERKSSQQSQVRPLVQAGQASKPVMTTGQGSLPAERTLRTPNLPTSKMDGPTSFYTQSQLYKDTTLKTKKKKNNLFTVNHNLLQTPHQYDDQRKRKICCNMSEDISCTNTWHMDESDPKNCILKNICNAYHTCTNANHVRTNERGVTKKVQNEINSLNTIDLHNAHNYHVKVKKISSSKRNQERQVWADEASFKNILFCNAHDTNFTKMALKNRNIESFHICSINSSGVDECPNANYRHQMENICIFRDF
ncbi:hypothetical protein AK88_01281 [Plasmodium fragile]|uniref:Uncharacterized protein n=1 Tax=Plasmodium fragile TaxID=5857 RepID=A0A0D9QPJ9_PLAFR|nr:uncharacterized protein AK88_01281 [Plasmodium fragile]KJP88989.1 hypothetical protein AK88_01281 [Plasmodium fragile]